MSSINLYAFKLTNDWCNEILLRIDRFNIFSCADADEDEPAAVAAVETPVAAKTSGKKRLKLINQFNYCERAALTYNNPSRV